MREFWRTEPLFHKAIYWTAGFQNTVVQDTSIFYSAWVTLADFAPNSCHVILRNIVKLWHFTSFMETFVLIVCSINRLLSVTTWAHLMSLRFTNPKEGTSWVRDYPIKPHYTFFTSDLPFGTVRILLFAFLSFPGRTYEASFFSSSCIVKKDIRCLTNFEANNKSSLFFLLTHPDTNRAHVSVRLSFSLPENSFFLSIISPKSQVGLLSPSENNIFLKRTPHRRALGNHVPASLYLWTKRSNLIGTPPANW